MTSIYVVKGLFAQRTLFSLAGLLKRSAAGRGRPLSLSPLEQALLVLFKLRYSLPDRALEVLFGVDHVTVSRAVRRALALMAGAPRALAQPGAWYAVDTTTIRIGRGKRQGHYTGYKHLSGIKLQVVANDRGEPVDVSDAHPASVHDHRIFRREWQRLSQRLDRTLPLLADKAYVGLDTLTEGQIQVPLKRGTRRQPAPTVERLSAKRVRVEHLFARLKCWKALANAHYHHERIAQMAQVILNWPIH